jgi:transcriptional regulator with GAF, ATPase, and Fis domain
MGSDRDVTANVRIIAATNRDLEADVAAGRFRQDLFHRIDGMRLTVPPLRDRPRDLSRLLDAALADWNRKNGTAKHLDDDVRSLLLAYRWPGNIRELGKVIVAAALMAPGDAVTKDHLPAKITAAEGDAGIGEVRLPDAGIHLKAYLVGIERDLFQQALDRSSGIGEKAAGLLGMKGPTFRKALRERHPDLRADE